MTSPKTQEGLTRLGQVIDAAGKRGRWLVLTHDNPDPDAIAAAAVLRGLLRQRFHHRATVAYGGIIGRAENQEMVKVLGLKLSPMRRLNWKHYAHVALVDTQPGTGNNQLPDDIVPDVVFDHHPIRKATHGAAFHDVRPDVGATATLLAEYHLAAELPVTKGLATALIYAIRSETQDFAREFAPPDQAVYDRILPLADRRALGRIQSPRLPASYFQTLHEALARLETVGSLIVSHLGTITQPDIVPEIADLLLRFEGKTWSLCTGVYDERIYLSLRTSNSRADAGRLMRRLLGRRGKGGGHGMIAGGWIPVDRSHNGEPTPLQRHLAARLARALKKNPERFAPIPMPASSGE